MAPDLPRTGPLITTARRTCADRYREPVILDSVILLSNDVSTLQGVPASV